MTIGAWDPNAHSPSFAIDPQCLRRFIALSETDQLDNLDQQLSSEEKVQQAPLMRQPRQAWNEVSEQFSDEELRHLVRFFTLAEMQLSGWEAGAESPVVWLVKALRLRQAPPDKDLLLWIKQHSDNRFLPNGAL